MSLRENLIEAAKVPSETIDVEGNKVEVRGLSVASRSKLFEGVDTDDVDLNRFYPELVRAAAYDPDSGEQIFSADTDRNVILNMAAGVVDQIAQKAMQLSGMQTEAVDEAAGNSESAQTDDSSSA